MPNFYKYFSTEEKIYKLYNFYCDELKIIDPKYTTEQKYLNYVYQFDPEAEIKLFFTPRYEKIVTIINMLEMCIRDIQDNGINISIEEIENEIERISSMYE